MYWRTFSDGGFQAVDDQFRGELAILIDARCNNIGHHYLIFVISASFCRFLQGRYVFRDSLLINRGGLRGCSPIRSFIIYVSL
jgi:hypothetical protein